jgi:hypothetical protein
MRTTGFKQNLTPVYRIFPLGITWGISAQYLIQYAALRFSNHHKSFPDQREYILRLSFGIQLLFGLVFLIGLLLLPQSPRSYTSYGLLGSAIGLIADLHARGDVSHPEVVAQCREMNEEIQIEREKSVPALYMFLRRPLAKRFSLGMSVQAWSQLSGISIMMCTSAMRLWKPKSFSDTCFYKHRQPCIRFGWIQSSRFAVCVGNNPVPLLLRLDRARLIRGG